MKKYFILIAILTIAFAGCKKETDDNTDDTQPYVLTPKQEQWGLVINHTSTGCSNCGYWGSPLLNTLANMNGSKVLAIAGHSSSYGDPMFCGLPYFNMSSDRQTGGGIPSFWVGDVKVYDQSAATSEMTTLISNTPLAGIDMVITRNTGNFTVKSKIKFFKQGQGDYYLGFYLLESGINGNSQSGAYAQQGTSDSNYKHNFVLRATNTQNFYGEKLTTSPQANAVFDKEITIAFDATWTNQLSIGAALWHYNPNGDPVNFIPKYEFVNAFVRK